MDVLEKIFGGAAKVKIIRLFVFNPEVTFDANTVAVRAKVSPRTVRIELRGLEEIGLVRSRTFLKERAPQKKGGKKIKMKVKGWALDQNFLYLEALRVFLIKTSVFQPKDLVSRLSRGGKIKLIIAAGVFIQEPESRVDLLVVGDNLRKNVVDGAVKVIESELGREIVYSAFETSDFQYRLSMFDKLIRDILDYPHQKIVDKLGVK